MDWSNRRKISIFLSFLGIVVIFLFFIYKIFFTQAPSCTDGKLNQGERGVDCGPVCVNSCQGDFDKPVVLYSKFIKIRDGIYNLFSLIENPNKNSVARNTQYVFKIYDKNGILVKEKVGVIDIENQKLVPISQNNIFLDKSTPKAVTLEFVREPFWQELKDNKTNFDIVSKEIKNNKLSIIIKNNSIERSGENKIYAVLLDKDKNIISFGETVISAIDSGEQSEVIVIIPGDTKELEEARYTDIYFIKND